ncbi:TetR/AcrR family transcriptional regulator [Paenalcaligenes sp. Me52]|uniref:TetR/AcrR family transcriptional regulator n=1 Tax=Paenalcaligenes sp. Me52 TaxID=3392038 RepID=UPI003D26F03C
MTTAHHIASSSLQLFYQNGFHATGVELLSREAGVTKKTLYRHFASKDILIAAALELRHTWFMDKMRRFIEASPEADRPLAYIDFIASWTREEGFFGCAFINAAAEFAAADMPPHQQAATHKQEVLEYVQQLCRQAQATQPELIGEQLYVVGEGLIVIGQVQGYQQSKVESAKMMAKMVWQSAC